MDRPSLVLSTSSIDDVSVTLAQDNVRNLARDHFIIM